MLSDLIKKSTTSVANQEVSTKKTHVVKNNHVVEKAPVVPRQRFDNLFVGDFNRDLRKTELWFSNPGVGKTTMFRKICSEWKQNGKIQDYIVVNCHEDLNVQSLFKTTTTEGSDWVFLFNNLFKAITDNMQKDYVIVFDEFNLLPMSVQKGLQPILDDTVGEFDFENNTYQKNPNLNFILTINHRDVGVNRLADAIMDRAFPVFFKDLPKETIAIRTKLPLTFIDLIERIYQMFANVGDLQPFHRSVRQLNYLHGLTKEQFKDYLISHLELAGIEWEQITRLSPEFDNALEEFKNIKL
jgi:hypothetical protein